jgi:hypothetical protein
MKTKLVKLYNFTNIGKILNYLKYKNTTKSKSMSSNLLKREIKQDGMYREASIYELEN